jgi:hypothetical protein
MCGHSFVYTFSDYENGKPKLGAQMRYYNP